ELLYNRRYRKIEAPWAYYTTAEAIKLNPVFAQGGNQIIDYLNAYATIFMAKANASNIAENIQVLGWLFYEVGSTIYLPHNGNCYYVQSVRHTFQVGEGWFTDMDLTYGRPVNADLFNYINQRAINIGVVKLDGTGQAQLTNPGGQVIGVTSSNHGSEYKDSPYNDQFPPLSSNLKAPVFAANTQCSVEQNWDVYSSFNNELPIHTGVDLT